MTPPSNLKQIAKPVAANVARLAVLKDCPSIVELYLESGRENGLKGLSAKSFARRIQALVKNGPSIFIIAGKPAKAVAFVHFKQEVWNENMSVLVEDVFVTSSARQQGFARSVMAFVIELANTRRANFTSLSVNEHNTAALNLYKTLGFCDSTPLHWAGGRELLLVLPNVTNCLNADEGPVCKSIRDQLELSGATRIA